MLCDYLVPQEGTDNLIYSVCKYSSNELQLLDYQHSTSYTQYNVTHQWLRKITMDIHDSNTGKVLETNFFIHQIHKWGSWLLRLSASKQFLLQ
jgi:hypothetical protein